MLFLDPFDGIQRLAVLSSVFEVPDNMVSSSSLNIVREGQFRGGSLGLKSGERPLVLLGAASSGFVPATSGLASPPVSLGAVLENLRVGVFSAAEKWPGSPVHLCSALISCSAIGSSPDSVIEEKSPGKASSYLGHS